MVLRLMLKEEDVRERREHLCGLWALLGAAFDNEFHWASVLGFGTKDNL